MTVSKQTLLNTLRTFKNLQESNDGGTQAVLDTLPATVNGGLWYDSDAPAIKLAHNGDEFTTSLVNTTRKFIDNILYIGDYQFQFVGLANGLTLHDGKFYAADDTNHTTELGTVTTTFDGDNLTACTFNFTALAALNVAVDDTISVTQVAGQTVALKLNLGDEIPTSSGSWKDVGGGYYLYKANTNSIFAARESANSFRFCSANVNATQDMFITSNPLRAGLLNATTSLLKADAPISVTETFDSNGDLTSILFTIANKSAFGDELWKTNSNWSFEFTNTDGTDNIPIAVEIEEGLAEKFDTATFEMDEDGVYTFTAAGLDTGFYTTYDNTNQTVLKYSRTKLGREPFTISGLVPNLTIVYDAENDCYNIVKQYDLDRVLGTITGRYLVTITNLDAVNATIGRVVLLTDSVADAVTYELHFDSSLLTKVVMAETEVEGTYAYPVSSGYLTADANNGYGVHAFTYNPTPQTQYQPFTLSGLKSGLGELTVANGQITTADGTKIATISNDRISLTYNALPNGANYQPSGHTITLEFEDHTLDIDFSIWGWFILDDEELSFTGSNGTYTVTATPNGGARSGFVYMNDDHKTLRWFNLTGTGSFTVSGLKTLSGTLAALRNLQNGYLLKAGDTVIGDVHGNVVTLNAAALPDNPTSGTAIQFTANTFDYNFKLGSDANARTFANESITAETTAGTYIYKASGSTAGWQVTPDGDKIIYAPELNGTTKILTGLRTDLGRLTFDEQGRIHAQNGGVVGFMSGSQITWYAHALLTPSTTATIE